MDKILPRRRLLLCLALALLLAGCDLLSAQNVDDLLRAPALAAGQGGEVQQALASALGEEPQYKFPRQGEHLSPLVLADLDGDGVEEGVLFYTYANTTANREKGNNIFLALLTQDENGWTMAQESPGFSSEVAVVELADLYGDGGLQLLVGYANATLATRTLIIYSYAGGVLTETRYPRSYSNFLTGDFTGQGRTDLAVAAIEQINNQPSMALRFLTAQGGALHYLQEDPVVLEKNITSCAGIHISDGPEGAEGQRLLIVDGYNETGGYLVSQILVARESGEGFYLREDWNELAAATVRYTLSLTARDIDGDGVVEIPVDSRLDSPTLAEDHRLMWVRWLDCTTPEPVAREVGMLDGDRSVYLRLPHSWQEEVTVYAGPRAQEWMMQRTRDSAPLLSLWELTEGEQPPADAVRVPGSLRSYLVLHSAVGPVARAGIAMTLLA